MDFVKENIAHTREKYMQPEEVAVFTRHVERGLDSFERKIISEYLEPGCRVLDAGCGAGREAFVLYEMGCRDITAIDISPAMIDAAKLENEKRGCGIKFREADVYAYSKDSEGTFDLILLITQLMCHIPGRRARIELLSNLGRLLTEKGVIILSTHNRHEGNRYRLRWKLLAFFMKVARALGLTRLEFGDLLATQVSEADSKKRAFVHIFTVEEVLGEVKEAGLKLVKARCNTEIDKGEEMPDFRGKDRYVFYVVSRQTSNVKH